MIRMLPGWPISPGCFVWWKKWSTSTCVPRGVEVLSPDCGWPRVHVEADYSSSAGLGDWLSIELSLGTVGTSSLEWKFAVFHSERPVMRGRYVVVRVGKGGKPQAIPESERECLISGFSKGGDACK